LYFLGGIMKHSRDRSRISVKRGPVTFDYGSKILQCYRAKRKIKNFASTDVKMHRQTQDSEYGAPLI
jgi:hypothetical protein